MDKKVFKRLEFHKVLEQLASFAGSPLGKERVMNLEPVDDPGIIIRWQKETTEGRELMRLDPTAEIGGWKDVRVQIKRADRGALLEPEELAAVADTLTAGRLLKNFLQERQERYPLLSELSFALASCRNWKKRSKVDLPGGEVADTASSELAQLRRKILNNQARIRSTWNT